MSRFRIFLRIAPCLFSIIIDFMGFGLVYPLVPYLFQDGVFPGIQSAAARNFFMGLASLLYPLFMTFGAAFLGDLSDRFGRKRILLLALLGIGMSFLVMASGVLYHSLTLFLLGRILSGLMAGSQPLSQAAVADLSQPESRAWNLSLVSLTNCVALAMGPLVAAIFASRPFSRTGTLQLALPFFVAAFLALVAVIWIALSFRETFQPSGERHFDLLRPLRIFREGILDPKVRPIAFIFIFSQASIGFFYLNIGALLSRIYDYGPGITGLFFTFFGASIVFFVSTLYPLLLRRFSLVQIAIWCLAGQGLGILLTGLFLQQLPTWILAFLIAGTNLPSYTAILGLFSLSASSERQGWVMGICTAISAIGFTLAGLSVNLYPVTGIAGVLLIGGLLGLLGGALMWPMRHRFASQ